MLKNEGKTDRIVRMTAGVFLILFSWFKLRPLCRLKVGIPGLILLATGALGYCGLYEVIGVDTLQGEEATPVL